MDDRGVTPVSNIAERLSEVARRSPARTAVIEPGRRRLDGTWTFRSTTFAELEGAANAAAQGLREMGIGPGVRTALFVPPSFEFFVAVFALFKLGAPLVCIDPGIGVRRLGDCLDRVRPQAFLGVGKALLAQRLFGWARSSLCLRIGVDRAAAWLGARALDRVVEDGNRSLGGREFAPASTRASDLAAVLFTSGSTGAPKGVLYEHRHFVAQVQMLGEMFAIAPGEVDLATFPLFGLFAPALEMTAVIPRMDFTRPKDVAPRMILELIEQFSVTNLFGSPALLDRVGRFAEPLGVKLPSLRRVVSAGAPVQASVVERFSRLLVAPAEVHTPYGATESLPVASIASAQIVAETRALTDVGHGVCVGRPAPGVEIRVLQIRDEAIPQMHADLEVARGEIGEIVVCGASTTLAYDGLEEETRLAKIEDADGRIWHRMGDLGRIDARGRLWFCGRKSQRVKTADGELYTVPCEAIFNVLPGVRRSALVGIPVAGNSALQRPVMWIEPEAAISSRERDRLLAELRETALRHPLTRTIENFRFHRAFPVDARHNSKIQREVLARLAAQADARN